MEFTDITNFLGITDTKRTGYTPPATSAFDIEKAGEKKVLYVWGAPSRILKPLNQKLIKNLIVIAVVISLLFIAMQEFLLVLVIISMAFVSYILYATPPEILRYEINTHGVSVAGRFYFWNDLKHFFFSGRSGFEVLCIDTKEGLPGRLFMTVNPGDREKLHEIMNKYLPYLEEEPMNVIDKVYFSVLDKFDLSGKQQGIQS